MKKYITKEELENSKPTEPSFLRLRITLGVFITSTLLGLAMFIFFVALFFVGAPELELEIAIKFLIGITFGISYLFYGLLLGLTAIIYKITKGIPRFIQKWLGIREYDKQLIVYHTLVYKYNAEQRYLKQQEYYNKNYEKYEKEM